MIVSPTLANGNTTDPAAQTRSQESITIRQPDPTPTPYDVCFAVPVSPFSIEVTVTVV